MDIFSGLKEIVEPKCSLSEHTWYGLGGKADYFITPENVQQLSQVVQRCNENNIRIHVLGFGTNILVRDDGVKGAVVKLDGGDFSQTRFEDDRLVACAGANMGETVLDCVHKGFSGIEALTGIPGSVGGGVKMNAGGGFGDIGTVVESVLLMDKEGNTFEKSKPELVFD